jgi:multiple antibiotic resistance protein
MISFSLIFAKALPLFLTLDPLGNTGIVATIIQRFDMPTQRKILRREVLIALGVMLFFYAVGAVFLAALHISQAAVEITGGIVLFIFTINLLFPNDSPIRISSGDQEPYIVPIAIPLIAGPSCLATIMLYSHESVNSFVVVGGILLAWGAAATILLLSPYIARVVGKVGLKVCEQIMGLICGMVAIKMFLRGITTFLASS